MTVSWTEFPTSPQADSAEGYVAKRDCEHGIDLVKKLAPDALVNDLT